MLVGKPAAPPSQDPRRELAGSASRVPAAPTESVASVPSVPPIAFALDFPTVDAAHAIAAQVARHVAYLKVGLELFISEGGAALALGRALDVPIFLDLKLHDIPETVERAVARACALGAKLLTVHACGGPAMLERAVARANAEATGLEIVAVTVLTSLDTADLARIGLRDEPRDAALRLARLAADAGVTHFVCSPHEARALRAALGADAVLITPGIRPGAAESADGKDASHADQKRVMTAGAAISEGADVLVLGRPIRDAKDPLGVVTAVAREIALAKSSMAERETRGAE